MAMRDTEKRDLLHEARETWLDAEETIWSYLAAIKKAQVLSKWLKRATILAALATAGATLPAWSTGGDPDAANLAAILATIGAMLTAGLATLDQQMAPAQEIVKRAKHKADLERIKVDLQGIALKMDAFESIDEGLALIAAAKRTVIGIRQEAPPPTPVAEYMSLANAGFDDSTIDRITKRVEAAVANAEAGQPVGLEGVAYQISDDEDEEDANAGAPAEDARLFRTVRPGV